MGTISVGADLMIVPTLCAHRYTQVRKTRKTGPKRKYLTECIPRGRRLAGDGVSSVTDRSLQKKHRRQAASHSPWSQQDSGITLSTGMGMIGVPEITLIVPTLCVGMPPRTLRVRSHRRRAAHSVPRRQFTVMILLLIRLTTLFIGRFLDPVPGHVQRRQEQ